MLDELREWFASYLSQHRACVLTTTGASGAWAMPVRYRNNGLEVDCLLPRWADVAYYVEESPHVLLVISGCHVDGLRWLEYRGMARLVAAPNWHALLPASWGPLTHRPDDLYVVIHVTPERIDLVDESRGWGARETLEV